MVSWLLMVCFVLSNQRQLSLPSLLSIEIPGNKSVHSCDGSLLLTRYRPTTAEGTPKSQPWNYDCFSWQLSLLPQLSLNRSEKILSNLMSQKQA